MVRECLAKLKHKTEEVKYSVLSELVFSVKWSGHFFAVSQIAPDTAQSY